jgi:hypothetical protein
MKNFVIAAVTVALFPVSAYSQKYKVFVARSMRGIRALYDACLCQFPSAGTPRQRLHLQRASR